MAEAVATVGGIVALAQAAFEASISLYNLVKSFNSHNSRVKELGEELRALSEVLQALGVHIQGTKVDASTLKIPLEQCTKICVDFQLEIDKCSARSSDTRTSFRDWARLRYMGNDIDGFRRTISSYKLTMTIALNDANLRASAQTAESVENYHDLIQTTQEDLRDRLQAMDEKLDNWLDDNTALSESESLEVKLIRKERLSAYKCLQICADLSNHVAQLQQAAIHEDVVGEGEPRAASTTRGIYADGLQECADSLARTAEKLSGYEHDLFDRLLDKSRTAAASEEDRITLEALRDQLSATRQSMAICSKAREHLREEVATIDNYATGDAIQLMVSVNDKPIHGRNRGTGWRTRQLGGYVDKESVRDAIRSFSNIHIAEVKHEASTAGSGPTSPGATAEDANSFESKSQSAFNGEGRSLAAHHRA